MHNDIKNSNTSYVINHHFNFDDHTFDNHSMFKREKAIIIDLRQR